MKIGLIEMKVKLISMELGAKIAKANLVNNSMLVVEYRIVKSTRHCNLTTINVRNWEMSGSFSSLRGKSI